MECKERTEKEAKKLGLGRGSTYAGGVKLQQYFSNLQQEELKDN
jgi:hypothetical protein